MYQNTISNDLRFINGFYYVTGQNCFANHISIYKNEGTKKKLMLSYIILTTAHETLITHNRNCSQADTFCDLLPLSLLIPLISQLIHRSEVNFRNYQLCQRCSFGLKHRRLKLYVHRIGSKTQQLTYLFRLNDV